MKPLFSILMCAAVLATLQPVTAASKVSNYEQALAKVNDDGYALFIYGKDWDKRAKEHITQLYNSPIVENALGHAATILVPLPEKMNEEQKESFNKTMGKLQLPHVHSKHSFPAVVLYDKTGRQYGIVCGPPMVNPEADRIARLITRLRKAKARQDQLMSQANAAQGAERARLLLQAAQVEYIERPDKVEQLIKTADPEDASGCLAALKFYNNPLGDKINELPLSEALKVMDAAIANPLHTVQQKQNACAFTIGLIRRRVGTGGAAAIAHYAGIMKELNPDSVLGRSAVIVMRDWTAGLQYVRGWSPDSLPMQGVATEIQGKLPIDAAGKYEVRFEPTRGKTPARVTRVALYDGETLVSEDTRAITLTSPASYYVTAEKKPAAPRILVTFDNDEKSRDTHGKFIIRKK
ncbi:MAG: hypothetical protein UHH87_08350 [Akkermansia sp.]|nr:hypothetical protein [Akkermansia sp.]